jgi:hypothetical protein
MGWVLRFSGLKAIHLYGFYFQWRIHKEQAQLQYLKIREENVF